MAWVEIAWAEIAWICRMGRMFEFLGVMVGVGAVREPPLRLCIPALRERGRACHSAAR